MNQSPFHSCSAVLLRALGIIITAALVAGNALAAPLSGVKSVGPTGDYASLTAAIADIQAVGNGLGGALILELRPTYVSTVEIFPLTVPAINGASAVNTLTIRPAAGATALAISSADTTAATVDLNGANYVTFDGRPGGAGTAKQLTIANTSTSGMALRFINEASSNTIKFVTFQGVNTSATSGTVVFSTTTGVNGNDNNTIDTCDIRDGTTTPANGIYSLGTTITTVQNNSGNTVTNCNIYNFYSTVDSAGVRLDAGNTDWIISGNSLYQTASQPYLGNVMNARPIYVNNISGNNFNIVGNFIGGSAPNAGGAAWADPGFPSYRFVGIQLKAGTLNASSVQGNMIKNIAWTTSSTTNALPGVWCGIYLEAGSANIGTTAGNTIGSGTGTDSVTLTYGGTSTFVVTSYGIGSTSSNAAVIANNTVGSITVNGIDTAHSASLTGIQVVAGENTISNNLVGSTTTLNSLNAATSSTSGTSQQVTGILSSNTVSASITSNMVANLNNNSMQTAGGAGQIRGIVTFAGVNTIIGNTVRNLSTTSQNGASGITLSVSVLGIADSSVTAGQTVSQNLVHSLANTALTAAGNVTGFYFQGQLTSGTNVIARNLIHSLSTSSSINGMVFVAGPFIVQNNMVRLGLKADGTSTPGVSGMSGIFDFGPSTGRNYYHNSVYLGGTQISGAANTFAFQNFTTGNGRTFKNNIFVNARSNGSGTGKHYAVQYSGSSLGSLTAGGNLFLANGTGGVLGLYSGADMTTLAAWQAATGQDATSLNTDPFFVNPTGNSATVDLHIATNSPAINAGLALAAVTNDFDGDLRPLIMPTIGADEIVHNHAPVAASPFTIGVKLGVPSTVKIIGGKHSPFDPDSDPLTITSVTGAVNGITSTDGTNVTYTATSGSTDTFTCAISDGNGGTTNQTVNVTITSAGSEGYNRLSAQSLGGGTNVLTFLGTPGFNYALESTTNLVTPVWVPQITNPAAANGWLIFTDVTSNSPVFYRTRYVP